MRNSSFDGFPNQSFNLLLGFATPHVAQGVAFSFACECRREVGGYIIQGITRDGSLGFVPSDFGALLLPGSVPPGGKGGPPSA